ncbi:DUF952 domain-containing protein [Nocardia sp. CC227C]|uniref:DUF952 domain-containing protein n=1 Tax=Nocardia sp. CC227C TaxID=3044562 RepID=UPI00278BD38E|nr:DUF952 domain-containing protein [Nocardia sp. CC227C]
MASDAPDHTGPLLHICSREEWAAARAAGELRAPSLAEAGFIHLSAPHQVHLPAERLFAGRRDLVLLWLDPTRLADPVRWEPGVPTDPESMRFPHLYGPLPVAAVVEVTDFRPGPEGRFVPVEMPRGDLS